MTARLSRGFLVTFEGGEGAGKTTLIEGMARTLASDGYFTVKTREPGGTHLGEHIRSLLLDSCASCAISPYAELCLFLASRAQHIEEVIQPALLERKIVLCDRYNDSSVAYQGSARKLGMEKVSHMCQFICHGVLPDLTFFLDLDPETGLSRARADHLQAAGARGYDRIESEEWAFHQQVRDAYREIHAREPKRFIVLDARLAPETVLARALEHMRLFINHVVTLSK
jgi:dTMP kinase